MALIKVYIIPMMIVFLLAKIAASERCCRIQHDNSGCPFYQIRQGETWCDIKEYSENELTLFVKPGNNFQSIKLSLPVEKDLHLERRNIMNGNKWYEIKIRKVPGIVFSDYIIAVVGLLSKELTTLNSETLKLMVKGSIFFAEGCNPENFKRQEDTDPATHSSIDTTTGDTTTDILQSISPEPATKGHIHHGWLYGIIGFLLIIIVVLTVIIIMKKTCKWGAGDTEVSQHGNNPSPTTRGGITQEYRNSLYGCLPELNNTD